MWSDSLARPSFSLMGPSFRCLPCVTIAEDGAVVDSELRVLGIDRLRVVDASVMPTVPSGNLNAPTQMIAMRGADFIRGVEQMAPERPRFAFEGSS